jgi:hypothetical protein
VMNNLPREMGRRLREYLNQQKGVQLHEWAAQALPRLSTPLQIEVILHCHRHWLDQIWFLRRLDELCLVRLAMSMTERVLAPGEVAPQGDLYVVARGLVLFGGRVLMKGMAWGDDVLLEEPAYFLPFLARAMTYVDVHCLSRETLQRNISAFPRAAEQVRRFTILLALRRHIVAAAKAVRRQRQETQGAEQSGGDMIDRAHGVPSSFKKAQQRSVSMAVELKKLQAERASNDIPAFEPGAMGALQFDVGQMRADIRELKETVGILAKSVESLHSRARWQSALPRRAPTISAPVSSVTPSLAGNGASPLVVDKAKQ